MVLPRPLALPSCLPSELLSFVIQQHVHPTTLLICTSRELFLNSLLSSILARQPDDVLSSSPPEPGSTTIEQTNSALMGQIDRAKPHHLLLQTLHQLSVSGQIEMVYIPNVSHLRAYLSVFLASSTSVDMSSSQPGRLVVYGLVNVHRDTSEWSAQGLGGALAAVVEASARTAKSLILVDALHRLDEDAGNTLYADGVDELNESRPATYEGREYSWKQKMPMLNNSIRRQFDADDPGAAKWMGRTVEVGAVLARWFEFAEESFWTEHCL